MAESVPRDHRRDLMIGVGSAAAAAGAIEAYHRLQSRDVADGKATRFQRIDPRRITTDPDAFQFKSGGDTSGVTDRLKGVSRWDQVAAGKAVVFERRDGTLVIADGHQRLGLAKRLAGAGQRVRMDAYVMRERDGWTPSDVRAYAALKNIKESSGTALDMAKVMRDRPDLVNGSVPMSDTKVKDAAALSKLSPKAFAMVAAGVVKPEIAAAVGGQVNDPTRHEGMMREIAKADLPNAQSARLYVSQALAAGSHTETNLSLFGEETTTRSLLAERAKVLDRAIAGLKSDKRVFGLLEREAGRVEAAGNKLAHETNRARAEGAGSMAELVEKLSLNRGPVSEMLDRAAKAVAEGENPAKAARGFVDNVHATLKSGGMSALTGAPAAVAEHVVADPNQRSMFDAPPKTSEGRQGWQDAARTASASSRRATAKGRTATVSRGPKAATPMQEAAYAPKVIKRSPTGRPMQRQPLRPGATERLEKSITEKADTMAKKKQAPAGQSSFLGEPTTKDKIAAEVRAKEAKGRTGDPMDTGLFGSSRNQTDLVDAVKAAQAAAVPSKPVSSPATPATVQSALSDASRDRSGTVMWSQFVKYMADNKGRLPQGAYNALREEGLKRYTERLRSGHAASVLDFSDLVKSGEDAISGFKSVTAKAAAAIDAARAEKSNPTGPTGGNRPGWSDAARAKSAEVRGEKAMGKPEPRGMDGLTRSERAARDGKAKPAAVTAAPADGATSMERFRSSYEATLRKQVEANPGKYGYGVDRVPEMAQKMTEALAKGAGDHTSPTVKAVVKSLGIKPTIGGIKAFLNDQPPPAPRPQKSPLEKAEIAATKAEAERMKAWKGMQAGHVSSPDYVKAAQAAEAARKALESAKAHPTTVISAGIRDSSGSLHVKNPDTNTWSVDKSAPKQIAPKGEISVPGDKGKVQKPRLSNPDVKALLKEGVITKDDVKRSKTMDDVRSIADRSRANRNADRGIDRPAPRPLSPMEQAAKNATFPDVPKVAEAAKGAGTPVPPKPSSGLRGTQNEANKAAIIENRKGKAKGKAKASNPNVEAVRTLSATAMGAKRKVFAGPTIESALATEAKRVQMAKDAVGVGAKPASTGKAPEVQGPPYYREVINRRNGIQSGTKMVKVPPKAPKPAKPGTKALGLLAPVALGTAMLAGANKAKAEGLGTAAQIKEAGKEGGKAAVTMGAFTVGTVGAVKGLMKLGMTAGRALPLVNAGMMVGGAIHGAVTAKPGERLAGAARGAWDMSLPGMVVNTASAAKEAVQGRVGTSPSTGGHDMGASFAQANQRYQAMREAAATTDPADKRKGWSNAARIAAAKARGASNLPYGGDAAAGPSQYAPK